jgi:hypothetical protein
MLTNYMIKQNMILPLDVYHGTPHTLPPTARNPLGEFDASKIGTGEGAQAYGHGIYTAESPGVAESYRKALSDNVFSVNGADLLGPSSKYGTTGQNPARAAQSTPEKMASYALDSAVKSGSADPAAAAIAHILRYGKGNPDATAALEVVRQWRVQGAKAEAGNLYKIDLPDKMIAKMLDWDKPMSEQPSNVQKFFAPYVEKMRKIEGGSSGSEWGDLAAPRTYDPTGNELLRLISQNNNMNAQTVLGGGLGPEVSAKLRQAGIPGIKYLDATSRDAGKGTRNFVTFPGEEKKMTILKRN